MMRKYKAGGAKKKKAMSGTKVKMAKSGTKAKKMGYGGKAASMVPSKAKKGKKVPKGFHRMPNGKLMKNSDMKKAGNGMMKKATYGAMKKAKSGLKKAPAGPKGKGMRSLPKDVRNKIGFAKKGTKKGMVRKTARKAYMKKGGSTRKCKSGCK